MTDDAIRLEPASVGVGIHDALTARLAERAGFDLVWLGSLEVSSRLGIPDRNLLTATEMAAAVREVRAAVELPIYVDADNGYGSDLTAVRAVGLFALAGAHTICIEDNAFPKRNSLSTAGSHELVDADAFAARLKRVCEIRGNLRIIARTEALVAGLGVAEAVARLRRYAETGVDGLFVQVNSLCRDELFPVLDEVRGLLPITLAPTAFPELQVADFARHGAATVVFANVVVRNMLATLPVMLSDLRRSGRLADVEDSIAPLHQVFDLVGDRL